MITDFEAAKIKTMRKWDGVLKAVEEVRFAKAGKCGFCESYHLCGDCPVEGFCGGEAHVNIYNLQRKLEEAVIEFISLLQELEEK